MLHQSSKAPQSRFNHNRLGKPTVDYRDYLRTEFAARKNRHPNYSLRAFARDIDLSPSRVSEILSGKDGLSVKTAVQIANRLSMSPVETDHFVTLVEMQHARSKLGRKVASLKLKALTLQRTHQLLQDECLTVLDRWYHFVILEMTRLKEFQFDYKWIAKRVGISPQEAQDATERLIRLGLLQEANETLSATTARFATPSDTPSATIRAYHRGILARASEQIDIQPMPEREYSASFFSIAVKDLPRAKEALKKMRREFVKGHENESEGDEVYCLGLQFFSVTKKAPK